MRKLAHRFGWFVLVVGLALAFAATMTIWGSKELALATLVIVFILLTAAGVRDTIRSMLEQGGPLDKPVDDRYHGPARHPQMR